MLTQDQKIKFYSSKSWRTVSHMARVKSNGACEKCGKIFDINKLHAHHKIELNENNINIPEISLSLDNIEVTCIRCHNEEHNRFGFNKKNVYIVYGSPCSGKSSFVEEQMGNNDIVLDLDSIWQCISSKPRYDKSRALRFNVFRVRDNILDQIKTRYGQWQNAYVIGGYADRYEREEVAKKLNAELIYIESTKAECIERAESKPKEWLEYIEEWWNRYEE